MHKLITIFIFCFCISSVFAQQAGKCPFPEPAHKVKNDQYGQSSKDAIEKSKKEMAQQEDVFERKKYQAVVRAKTPAKKQKQVMRYE